MLNEQLRAGLLNGDKEASQLLHETVASNMELDPMAMLRRLYGIKITGATQVFPGDGTKYVYTVWGSLGERTEVGTGAADLTGLCSHDWANAIKGAETQAKRRLTTSLIGYGFKAKEEESPALVSAAEPAVNELPTVNNAKADVTVDLRATGNPSAAQLLAQQALKSVPANGPEPQPLTKVANQVAAQTPDVAGAVDAPKVQSNQPSIFDEEPVESFPTPSPAPVVITPVVVATAAVEPPPVQDIVVTPIVTDKPTRLQYQSYTMRCTKLVRDVLPKAGKDAPNLLLPYLRKIFGAQTLSEETTTILQWEEVLARLEGAGSPADVYRILKDGK